MNPKYHSNLAVALVRLGNGPILEWRETYQEAHRESTAALALQADLQSALEIREQILGNIAKRVEADFSDEQMVRVEVKRIVAGAYSDMTSSSDAATSSGSDDGPTSAADATEHGDESTAPVLDARLWDFLVQNGLEHRYDDMYDYGIDAMDLLEEVERADLDAVGFSATERHVLQKALNAASSHTARAEL